MARDEAFNFYYRDNLEMMELAGRQGRSLQPGARRMLCRMWTVSTSAEAIRSFMPASCLKMQGMRRSLEKAHERDLPIYAECGGLMYLAREIEWDGERQEMVGLVPGNVRRGSIRVVSYVHGRFARDLPARARGRADHGARVSPLRDADGRE